MRIRVGKVASVSWRVALVGSIVFAGLWGLFGYKIRSLTPGYSKLEITTASTNQSISMILENPINAPYKTTQLLLQKINHRTVFVNRIISAMIISSATLAFFGLVLHITTKRIAIFGTLLFASSSYSLHLGRSGTLESLPYLFIVFLAGCAHLAFGKKFHKLLMFIMLFCIGNLLYVPGMLWILIPLVVWQFKRAIRFLHDQPIWFLFCFVGLSVIMILPLVWGIITSPSTITELLLIPTKFPDIKLFASNFSQPFKELFFRREADPAHWLSPTPILDATATVLCMLGFYRIAFQSKLDRFWILSISFIIVSIFAGLGNTSLMPVFVSMIFVVIALGLALILQQWQTVFPKNPFIKWVTLSISISMVLVSFGYQTTRYFRAWANSPKTKNAMVNQQR